jgi:hypothetical protein
MTPERFRLISELYDAAATLDPSLGGNRTGPLSGAAVISANFVQSVQAAAHGLIAFVKLGGRGSPAPALFASFF